MKVQAVVFDKGEQISIREVGLPEITETQFRTETLYSFVSPGTELRTLAGHYGASECFPIIPGYATVSRVVEVGAQIKGYKVGDLVSIESESTRILGYAALVFLLPLAFAAVGWFVAGIWTASLLWKGVGALIGVVITFAGLWAFSKKLQKGTGVSVITEILEDRN